MGIKDPHDPRMFQHFAKLGTDGSVLAIVEVAVDDAAPMDAPYIDVTDLSPADFSAVKVDPVLVATLTSAAKDVVSQQAALAAAKQAHGEASQEIQTAIAAALAPVAHGAPIVK